MSAPSTNPACPSCGSTRLTPPTRVRTGSGANARLRYDWDDDSFFGVSLEADVGGRVCVSCGHVTLCLLSADDMSRLRANLHQL